MSSTISSTEIKTMPRKLRVSEMKPTARLVRTSSIEKIRRFNSFICSQHYFVFPALISWLKTSQSGFHKQVEKTVFLLRMIFFSTYVYRICQKELKYVSNNCKIELKNRYTIISEFLKSFVVLKFIVHLAAVVVLAKFALCIYLLYTVHVPIGLYFLIICLSYINYLYYKTLSFRTNKKKCDNKKNK